MCTARLGVALPVTLSQRLPESLCHFAYSVIRHPERFEDKGGVISVRPV